MGHLQYVADVLTGRAAARIRAQARKRKLPWLSQELDEQVVTAAQAGYDAKRDISKPRKKVIISDVKAHEAVLRLTRTAYSAEVSTKLFLVRSHEDLMKCAYMAGRDLARKDAACAASRCGSTHTKCQSHKAVDEVLNDLNKYLHGTQFTREQAHRVIDWVGERTKWN